MLVGAYIVSALLEMAGIAVVIWDVRQDRRQALGFVDRPRRVRVPWQRGSWTMQAAIEDHDIAKGGAYGQMLSRGRSEAAARSVQQVAMGAAQAELETRQAIAGLLRGNFYRRLGGPALVLLGIVIGTAANIAAT
jgi:hypothetical protein